MASSNDLVMRRGAATAELVAARSRASLDVVLDGDAELWITAPTTEATVIGAFQRVVDVFALRRQDLARSSDPPGAHPARSIARRGSGGGAVEVGPGMLHVLVALRHPAALVPCDAPRLVNRYVRPLLHALTREGATARYFGRDWVSVMHRPAAAVGFAHDATTGRAAFEAFVAVTAPFVARARASFLGKPPTTLAEATGRDVDIDALAVRIADAYAAASGRALRAEPLDGVALGPDDTRAEPVERPWSALRDEAIGQVAAGSDRHGLVRVGGEFMASRDAVARLERALAGLPWDASPEAVGAAIDDAFTAPGVALDGVRSLASLRDVVVDARAAAAAVDARR